MSIQDKIFDVEDALEGKPEAELFEELITYLAKLETELDAYREYHKAFTYLKIAIQNIESEST